MPETQTNLAWRTLYLEPVPDTRPGLLLGYGNLNDSVIDEAAGILADIIEHR